jgi:hypothetical protein
MLLLFEVVGVQTAVSGFKICTPKWDMTIKDILALFEFFFLCLQQSFPAQGWAF